MDIREYLLEMLSTQDKATLLFDDCSSSESHTADFIPGR